MSHENARKGISRVFTAEILCIIAEVCALLMIIPVVGTIIGGVGFTVLSIIAVIVMVVGLNIAGKDNVLLKSAFTLAVIQLILSVVFGGLFMIPALQDWIGSLGSIISMVLGLMITHHILYGCAELNPDLREKADSTWKIYLVVIILDVIVLAAEIIMAIVGATGVFAVITIIASLADVVLSIIAYILFIVFLSKAKKAL